MHFLKQIYKFNGSFLLIFNKTPPPSSNIVINMSAGLCFSETNHGKEGFSDKGTEEEASEGYKGRNGKEAYQKDYSQYKHKQGNENGKEYAYNDRSKEDY